MDEEQYRYYAVWAGDKKPVMLGFMQYPDEFPSTVIGRCPDCGGIITLFYNLPKEIVKSAGPYDCFAIRCSRCTFDRYTAATVCGPYLD